MTFHVHAGDEETKAAVDAMVEREELLLQLGMARRTIFLNGGSQTRTDVIESWKDYARTRNMRFEVRGRSMIIIGGQGA